MKAERLRNLREARGYTQDDLAELIGTTRLQIYRWESGKHDPPSEAVAALAKVLGVSSDYLLGLSDSFNSNTKLSLAETTVVSAMRSGDYKTAIKAIVNE